VRQAIVLAIGISLVVGMAGAWVFGQLQEAPEQPRQHSKSASRT